MSLSIHPKMPVRAGRPGEVLHKDIARQEAAQLIANVLLRAVRRGAVLLRICLAVRKLAPQLLVETRGFFAEHDKMQQRLGVDDEDYKGGQSKKGEERQFDIKEGQFDGAFQ